MEGKTSWGREYEELVFDENGDFTKDEPGIYEIELTGKGFFGLEKDFSRLVKRIEFLSAKPVADFNIAGGLKMYKKISLDGTLSVEKTNSELQNKHPIQFDSLKTMFIIEPLKESAGEIDWERMILLGEKGGK